MNRIQIWLRRSLGPVLLGGVLLGLAACGTRDTDASWAHDQNVFAFTRENFKAEALSWSQPVLVDFWAAWCPPCKQMAPVIAEIAGEFLGRVKVGNVNVDAELALAKEYNVSILPTFLIFKDGKQVDQIIGILSKDDLKAKLNHLIETGAPAKP